MSKGTWLGMIIGSAYVFSASCAHAQITPDNTLPNNSNVTINGRVFNITGGTQAGHNLFHSFQQFSVPTRGTASFNNGLDIQNIFSRVTGDSASIIDGLIQASGTANLFFLNPNGIVFGKNARLNIGGSFVATTANAIQFGNIGTFSASVPDNPALLTVNPSALLYNQLASGAAIQNSSTEPAGTAPTGLSSSGLRVPDGKSLLLVGGNINMDGGQLNAYGGRVELGGLAAPGTVGVEVNSNNLSLVFPNNVTLNDVSLINEAGINVAAGGGGNIAVNARNLDIMSGSILSAGIGKGLGSINSQAGDITLNTTEEIKVVGESGVFNNVRSQAIGNGGNVTINTHKLLVQDGSQISDSISGAGKGGNLTINADSVQLIGVFADDQFASGLLVDTGLGAIGDAGNLTINTHELLVRDGAQVQTDTYGAGKGGNLTINADSVQLVGISADGQSASGLFVSNQPGSTGAGGNLIINTHELLVRDGAQAGTGTFGAGKGGNFTVNADSVQLIGISVESQTSGLFVSSEPGATGDAGALTINTRELLINGAFVGADTYGMGKGGNLAINTRELLMLNGATVGASTYGVGKGGILTVTTDSVQLIGTSADSQFATGLFASSEPGATGDAGTLTINTQQLQVLDGADVSTRTLGVGKGGDLTITANSMQLVGTSANGQFPSALETNTSGRNTTGNAGNLTINTQQLLVRDGAQVSAGTFGTGKGGNLTVNADSIQLIGISADGQSPSGLLASNQPGSTGAAGNLTINTRKLLVQNGARVSVESLGTGNAGNLEITARSIKLDNNAVLIANTQSINTDPNQEQATIILRAKDLILTRSSNITTNATGNDVIGGNINIDTDVLAALDNSHISANSTDFRGGKVIINTSGIFLSPESTITATGASPLFNGIVQINTSDINPAQGLLQLSTNLINTNTLIANSCIARTKKQQGTFNITGTGGLPSHPGDAFISSYPTGTVRNIQGNGTSSSWHKGDPIIEPQGVYQLPNGHLVLSRECS